METVDVVIVGSGFSGIGAAIELQNKGFHDYVVLEKADDLGGTWRLADAQQFLLPGYQAQ